MSAYTGPRTITAKYFPEVTRQAGRIDEAGNWVEDGETYVSRGAHWVGYIDRSSYHGTNGSTEAEAIANAGKRAAKMDIDAAIYPAAKAVAADLDGAVPAEGQTKDDFFVGQRVAVWSHNRRRVGLVEKVGKVNVTVVVVVASSGNLCRATSKFDDTVILEAVEAAETEADEPCDCSCHTEGDAGMPGCCSCTPARDHKCEPTGQFISDGRDELSCGSIANPAGYCSDGGGYVRPQPQDDGGRGTLRHRLLGLRTERSSLRARIPAGSNQRPELQARLERVEAELIALAETADPAPASCLWCDEPALPTGELCDRHAFPGHRPAERKVVEVGLDGRSQPMLRYADELHLPDHMRSSVAR